MIIKIKNKELIQELIGEVKEFPKYTTQLINLANQNAQGTRSRVVGQLSELIKECPKKTYQGWKKWYLLRHPKAVENATEKINKMIGNLKKAIKAIDKQMIRKWAEDLILEKTFVGLRFQEAILKKNCFNQKSQLSICLPKRRIARDRRIYWRYSRVHKTDDLQN